MTQGGRNDDENPHDAGKSPRAVGKDWTERHLWQIEPIRDVLVALGLYFFLSLGARLSIVTVPFLVALLLAYLFDPLLTRLEKVRFFSRRSAAAAFAIGASVIVGGSLAIGFGFGVIQSARLATTLTAKASAVLKSVDDPENAELRTALGSGAWLSIRDSIVDLRSRESSTATTAEGEPPRGHLRYLGIEREDVAAAIDRGIAWLRTNSSLVTEQAIATGAGAVGSAVSFVGSLGFTLFGLFLTAFFFFFFATEWDAVVGFVRSLLPDDNRDRAVEIAHKMDRAISGFIRGRLLIALFLAGFYTSGFTFMGVPAPLLMGGAIALLSLVPYAVLCGIPFVIVFLWLESLTGFRGTWWWIVGAPIVWYQVGQILDDYILTPAIQGKATDLATPEIVFASLAAGSLFGIFGLLVAIPSAACLKILVKEVFWPRYRAWSRSRTASS